MRGLKTNEGKNFENFFQLVQMEARKEKCVFFLYSDEENNKNTEKMEIADLSGWLIPETKADEFEKIWKNSQHNAELENWSEQFFVFAFWTEADGEIKIEFKSF